MNMNTTNSWKIALFAFFFMIFCFFLQFFIVSDFSLSWSFVASLYFFPAIAVCTLSFYLLSRFKLLKRMGYSSIVLVSVLYIFGFTLFMGYFQESFNPIIGYMLDILIAIVFTYIIYFGLGYFLYIIAIKRSNVVKVLLLFGSYLIGVSTACLNIVPHRETGRWSVVEGQKVAFLPLDFVSYTKSEKNERNDTTKTERYIMNEEVAVLFSSIIFEQKYGERTCLDMPYKVYEDNINWMVSDEKEKRTVILPKDLLSIIIR